MDIGIEGLDKRYGSFQALHGLDLQIASASMAELYCLLMIQLPKLSFSSSDGARW